MIGSNIPPYPKRCGEIGCVFGGARYQHVLAAVIAAKYENTTEATIDAVLGYPLALNEATV